MQKFPRGFTQHAIALSGYLTAVVGYRRANSRMTLEESVIPHVVSIFCTTIVAQNIKITGNVWLGVGHLVLKIGSLAALVAATRGMIALLQC